MSDCHIISHYPSDTLGMSIEYRSANLYNTYIMYNPADVRWHVLIDIMSQYYPCYYRIFGLNALSAESHTYKLISYIYGSTYLFFLFFNLNTFFIFITFLVISQLLRE